jgi:TolA-binding protein
VTPVEPAPSAAPEPAAPQPSAAAPPSSPPRNEERARSLGSLRAERLLIETASAALVRGDNASAIAALRQHARTFPKGDLAEEREVLLVKALAASGDDAAAKRRAKDFKSKFPGSVQQNSVDKAAQPK